MVLVLVNDNSPDLNEQKHKYYISRSEWNIRAKAAVCCQSRISFHPM